jgi:hypothetical protein
VLAVSVERVLDPKVVGLLIKLLSKVDSLPEEVNSNVDFVLLDRIADELLDQEVNTLISGVSICINKENAENFQ